MRKTALILLLVLLISVSVFASPFKRTSNTLYASYQGILADDAVHSVGGGIDFRTHLFGLPLFTYGDGNIGWPFIHPTASEGNHASIIFNASFGLGWQFIIMDNLALSIGGGAYLWGIFDMGVSDNSTTAQMQFAGGVEFLVELRYLFSDYFYLSTAFDPSLSLLRFGGYAGKKSDVLGGAFEFQPQVKVGIGVQYGRVLSSEEDKVEGAIYD